MAFQLWLRISRIIVPLWFLIFLTLPLIQAETHSLYYIYTGLSKPVDLPGMYEFTAMGLLDDTQIDYYNSKEKRKIPKQPWMKEKMTEDYWEKGTQTRTIKEQWFNVSVQTLMVRMRHNESDLHVLQWRTGCEVEQQGDEVKFLKGVSEFSYDGEDFLSFDIKESQWVAPVDAALLTKRKWDNVPILNQNTKDYLEKECVDWLNRFREYGDEELRNGSPPKVHVFSRKSTDETKLNLTCLATGFYPKAVVMIIRKYRTSLPEDEIKSSGIRPNHDGSYQLRKSVEIKEEEKAVYYCFVSHKSIKEQIIKTWGISHDNTSNISKVLTGAAIGGGLTLAVFALVFYILLKKNIIVCHPPTPDEDEIAGVPLLQVTGPMDKGSENSFSTDSVYHYTNPPTPDEDEIAGVPLLQVTVPMETRSENSFSTDSGRGTAGGQTDFSGSWSWDLNESA